MNERLSLQNLIDLLAEKRDITKKEAENFLRELIALISENIESNEPVKVKDFGTFKLVKINARKSVDVNTGEAIEIPAHYKLSFAPDKSLKDAINRPFAHFESVVLEDGVSFEDIIIADEEGEEDSEDNIAEDKKKTEPISAIEAAIRDMEEARDISSIIENTSQETTEPEIENIAELEPDTDPDPINEADPEDEFITEEKAEEEGAAIEITEEDETIDLLSEPVKQSIPDAGDDGFEDEYIIYLRTLSQRRKKYAIIGLLAFLVLGLFAAGVYYYKDIAEYAAYTTGGYEPVNQEVTATEDTTRIDPLAAHLSDSLRTDSLRADLLKTDSLRADLFKADSLKAALHKADSLKANLSKVDPVKPAKPQVKKDAPLGTETIKSKQTLRLISLKYYGHKSFWVYIYQDNKSVIKNPNNVAIGTKLIIPSPAKYNINVKNKESVDKAKKAESKLIRELGL